MNLGLCTTECKDGLYGDPAPNIRKCVYTCSMNLYADPTTMTCVQICP